MRAYMKERRRLNAMLKIDAILLAVFAVSIAAYYLLRARPGFADEVCRVFSAPTRAMLGRFWGIVPFSATELFYIVCILFVIFHVIYTIVRVRRSFMRLRQFLHRVLVLLAAASFLWSLYGWPWGVEYYARGFSDETGIPTAAPANVEELFKVTAGFLAAANALSSEVPRDKDGHFVCDTDAIFDKAPTLYDNLAEYFPNLAGECRRPKPMMFSKVMSAMGFTGVYFAYTGESNINVDIPGCFIPSTVAHELAHQLGYASEQECNFIGILACISSGDTSYSYSGYLCGLVYLMNALYSSDYEAWSYLRENFSPELETDWRDNSAYWEKYDSPVDTFFENLYDGYLKGNGQSLGIYSYDACVTMLVEYFKA